MRRVLPLLSLLLLAGTPSRGQTRFQRAFGPLVTSNAFDVRHVVRHANGEWSMRASQPHPSTVLRLNPDGTNRWIRALSSTDFSTNGGISTLGAGPDHSMIIVRTDTVEQLGPDQSRRAFDLIRLDAGATLDWAWRYRFDVPESIVVPSGGQELAVAADGNFYLSSGEPSRPLIMRFSDNGGLVWTKEIVAAFPIGRIKSMVTDTDGGCVFLANGSSVFSEPERILLMKIGPDGSMLWEHSIDPAAVGRLFQPNRVIRRADGHFLVSALEYGSGAPAAGVVLDLQPEGSLNWSTRYSFGTQGSLTTYSVVERSDGHLWMDFQQGGYGFAHLDAQGGVVDAQRFTYQSMGNTVGVVAWEETLIHEDHLGVVGGYFQDQSWTTNDPRTEFLWSLNAMEPDLCGTESVEIIGTELPATDLLVGSGLSLVGATITGELIPAVSQPPVLPPEEASCGIILGEAEGGSTDVPLVWPTWVECGATVQVGSRNGNRVQLIDMGGRILREQRLGTTGKAALVMEGLPAGALLLQVRDDRGQVVGTARMMLY